MQQNEKSMQLGKQDYEPCNKTPNDANETGKPRRNANNGIKNHKDEEAWRMLLKRHKKAIDEPSPWKTEA